MLKISIIVLQAVMMVLEGISKYKKQYSYMNNREIK